MRVSFEAQKSGTYAMARSPAEPMVIPKGFFVLNLNLPLFLENSCEKVVILIFLCTGCFTAVAVKNN